MSKSKKIPKKVRRDAVRICQCAALCHPATLDGTPFYEEVAQVLGIKDPFAYYLAVDAWGTMSTRPWTRQVDAEAAAMLACGWSPGDPVPR